MAGWDLDCLEQPFIPEVITNIIFYGCYDRKKVRKHDIENLKQPTITVVMCSYGDRVRGGLWDGGVEHYKPWD